MEGQVLLVSDGGGDEGKMMGKKKKKGTRRGHHFLSEIELFKSYNKTFRARQVMSNDMPCEIFQR